MTKRILIQFDCDPHPSVFDSVVAIDAGVDHLLQYSNVQATNLAPLVHGAMFTRGGDQLRRTAIFIGGADVDAAENLMKACQDAFFGPIRVSVMLDANGCNTTASAAVVAAGRHAELAGARAVVLGGTGPVGRRVAQLLASDGAEVKLTSRSLERASIACRDVGLRVINGSVTPVGLGSEESTRAVLADANLVFACGAAGFELVSEEIITGMESLAVAIDLNAVPPAGIGGVGVSDKAKPLGRGVAYGAIGVGGLKMKTHRAAVAALFERNDQVLNADEIYAIAKSIG